MLFDPVIFRFISIVQLNLEFIFLSEAEILYISMYVLAHSGLQYTHTIERITTCVEFLPKVSLQLLFVVVFTTRMERPLYAPPLLLLELKNYTSLQYSW